MFAEEEINPWLESGWTLQAVRTHQLRKVCPLACHAPTALFSEGVSPMTRLASPRLTVASLLLWEAEFG